jgi:hypothetical protein
MAIDLETGEIGEASNLMVAAIARRRKRWDNYVGEGLNRVKDWTRKNPNRRVTPTRFYKLLHGERVA